MNREPAAAIQMPGIYPVAATPESDAFFLGKDAGTILSINAYDFARKLEREREEARDLLADCPLLYATTFNAAELAWIKRVCPHSIM